MHPHSLIDALGLNSMIFLSVQDRTYQAAVAEPAPCQFTKTGYLIYVE